MRNIAGQNESTGWTSEVWISSVVFIFITFQVFNSHTVKAGTLQEDFFNENLLAAAQSEILKMPLEEVNALRDYMAECTESLSGNELIRHHCNVATARFQLEWEQDRAIDSLISVIGHFSNYIRITDKIARRRPKGDPKARKQLEEVSDLIVRLIDIRLALTQSLRHRYSVLRNSR